MYKKPSNISNPKKVNQTYKRKRNRRNPYLPPLKCLRNNPATINFKTNFPKLFNHPKVQLKRMPEMASQSSQHYSQKFNTKSRN